MRFVLLFLLVVQIFISETFADNNQNIMNKFTLEFYKSAVQKNPNDNLISSPMSVEILLGLLAFGARNETQNEIFTTLDLNNLNSIESQFKSTLNKLNKQDGGVLRIANKIYLKDRKGFALSPDFKRAAVDIFSSDVENIDFQKKQQAADTINRWVEDKTNNKIQNFVDPVKLNPNTVVSLINAIYFQGNWKQQFDTRFTSERSFIKSANSQSNVKMMFMDDDFHYAKLPELDSQILGLPYKMENTQLLVILPNKINGLTELERKITNLNVKDLIKKMQLTEEVEVHLPKFKIESSIELMDILVELGIQRIFDIKRADLSGILENSELELYVDYAKQKAFIDVNEIGTEAAAVTEIRAVPMMLNLDKIRFIADHPFLFLLVNNDDIIFCGRFIGA